MKKIVAMFVMAIMAMQVAFAGEVVTKDENQLPVAARQLIKKHFPQAKISYIKIDKDLFKSTTYEATLTNGTEIDFDCKKAAVPAAFVPGYVANYVNTDFAGEKIVKIERERKGYEVKLSNGMDVKFDVHGKLLKLDD